MNDNSMAVGLDAFMGVVISGLGFIFVVFALTTVLSHLVRSKTPGPGGRGRHPSEPRQSARPSAPPADTGRDPFDLAASQMRSVGESGFERVPLLNRQEARVLPILERVVREAGTGHRVMAQTSLGEVIQPVVGSPDEAVTAINSKRLDFAIFDRRGLIVCALEYQGTGHWQGQAAMRDGVKREALRKAGVRVIEVHPDFVEATLAQSVQDLLMPPVRRA